MTTTAENAHEHTGAKGYLRIAFHTLLTCAAIGVLLQNFLLLRQNKQLRALAKSPDVTAGQRVGDLAAVDMNGTFKPIALPASQRDRLVLIAMAPTCPISNANRDTWMEMTRALKQRAGWKVVWVSRDPVGMTRSYCERYGIPIEDMVADPVHRTYSQLDMEEVPHMIVVTSSGLVERVWGGRLNPNMTEDIMAYFDKPLSGAALRIPPVPWSDWIVHSAVQANERSL